MKHTELPWRINKRASMLVEANNRSVCSTGGYSNISEGDAVYDENQANAAFIVKACNNHYQMLEQLKSFSWFIEKQVNLGYLNHPEWAKRLNDVKEAIKQAEEA